MPMSPLIRHSRLPTSRQACRTGRAGMTLVEILVVLAIFALTTAIIMPSTARMMDQATSHAVFFEFQRDVSALRREANRQGVAINLVDPAVRIDPGSGDRKIRLRDPWTYTIAPSLGIAEGGACGAASVNLLTDDRVVMSLRTEDGSCQFSRLQTTVEPRREPSSR